MRAPPGRPILQTNVDQLAELTALVRGELSDLQVGGCRGCRFASALLPAGLHRPSSRARPTAAAPPPADPPPWPRPQRRVMGALITIDVHARDIVEQLAASGVTSSSDFGWQMQLRYYWEDEDLAVRQVGGRGLLLAVVAVVAGGVVWREWCSEVKCTGVAFTCAAAR